MSPSSSQSILVPAEPAENDHPSPKPQSWFGTLLGSVPMLLTFALLAGVAYWGHLTEWKFSLTQGASQPANAKQANDFLTVEFEPSARDRAVNDARCFAVGHSVRVASKEAAEKLGIDIAPAWETAMTESVSASGEASFDVTRVARLAARVPGTAWQVNKQIGDTVQAGELLAIIDAAEVGKSKAEFLQSMVQMRLKTQALANLKNAPVPERQKKEAEAARRDAEVRLLSAEQALVNLGLTVKAAEFGNLEVENIANQLQRLGLSRELSKTDIDLPGTLLPLRATFDGVVMHVDVIAGEVVDPEDVLFVVADPRQMSVQMNVLATDANWVRVGQAVRFRPDGIKAEFRGQVAWIGTSADEITRTVPVRVDLPNGDGKLRASALGVGQIVLRENPQAITVPNEAVQSIGGCQVVFVRDKGFLKPNGPKLFHTRMVRTGAKDATNTEIIVGVAQGEVVVTKGSSLFASEIKRSQSAAIAEQTTTHPSHTVHE